jgi:prepilin-type N-terminal cleavage/methylation domain-containing protein
MSGDTVRRRDSGFTLIEAVICIALMGLLASVVSTAIVVTLRSSPAVADRADAAVNVQGLVTWLPQDVDSAAPGTFDTDPAATSGCTGTDPGFNLLKVTWYEQITSLTNFAASYRYVPEAVPADGGKIVRVYCVVGTAPAVLTVSGTIPEWVAGSEPVEITLTDSPADPDTLVDSAKFSIEPLIGKTIVIDATTKNPNEELSNPAPPPPPPPPPPSPTNNPPVAAYTTQTIDVETNVTVTASASDPDGDPLTLTLSVIPAGWTVTPTTGLAMTVRAPLTAFGTTGFITFVVTDTSGATGTATISVNATGTPLNGPPSASPSSGSTTAGVPVTVDLAASDPENGALTATVSGVPASWTSSVSGKSVTVTPPNTAPSGTTTLNYTVTDPFGATASSTLTITVTGPPPCVVSGPALSSTSVPVKKNDPDSLSAEVTVTITIVSGYCVGLSLRYDTGAPNSQYVRTFGTSGTVRSVTLPKHPSPELWTVGTHALDVQDGTASVIASADLEVTP